MRIEDVIRRPLITEKATDMSEVDTYAFEVAAQANKIEVRRAVEVQFERKVAEVRIANMHGKLRRQGRYFGRRRDWKKAYVRLAAGEKPIEFFEGA
ncbi:MAG: 50S ribosomal protein L23 [Acidobacteriota bacterium]